MAGGKETPRQKMIGMMYLVLTALGLVNPQMHPPTPCRPLQPTTTAPDTSYRPARSCSTSSA